MAAHSAIDIVQQNSLTTLVRRELERRILDGGLVPGSKLNEAELASELRV